MPTFTFVHVLISLIAIASGLVVLFGMLRSDRMNMMTAIFLLFTVLTSATGFLFPFHGATPAFKLGIIASVVLIPTLLARYAFNMMGAWRWIYAVSAIMSLYLNCFVLVVQSFLKIASLHALAPKGAEPPFVIIQGLVLLLFIVAGFFAVRWFRPGYRNSRY